VPHGGCPGIRFFTNFDSRKGLELRDNPRAAAVFHWPALGRQLRLEGVVEKLPDADSDAYFAGRPRGSQLAACVSPQSRPIDGIAGLRQQAAALAVALEGREVARPVGWGGYRLVPDAIEFWLDGHDRLHERTRYELHDGGWRMQNLAP
jgi:pyridoxamine 5'-phosphate oxidase